MTEAFRKFVFTILAAAALIAAPVGAHIAWANDHKEQGEEAASDDKADKADDSAEDEDEEEDEHEDHADEGDGE